MVIHGDPGHSCYDENGELTCVVAKYMLFAGPGWQALAAMPPEEYAQLVGHNP